jgi:hypothetical protein
MVARDARVWDPAVARVRRFCDQRVPAETRDQVRLEVTTWASTITIVEYRPLWQGAGCVDPPADRPTSLRRFRGHLDPVLGGSQPTLASLRPPRPHPPARRAPQGDRPGPPLPLLGIAPLLSSRAIKLQPAMRLMTSSHATGASPMGGYVAPIGGSPSKRVPPHSRDARITVCV